MRKYPKRNNGKKLRVYVVWDNMIQRCTNPNNPNYKYYGARGITVCESWLSYDNFYEWAMTNGYNENKTRKEQSLDRKDNNKGYSPENCRWVNMKVQGRNRRNNVRVQGKCLSEIAEIAGLNDSVIASRYKSGSKDLESLSKPCRNPVIIDGLTIQEIAKREGIPEHLIRNRWRKGIRDIDKLLDPVNKNKAQREKVLIGGKTFIELSRESGIPIGVLRNRYWMQGKQTLEEILSPYNPKPRRTALK